MLLAVLATLGLRAWQVKQERTSRHAWTRPLGVSVVLVTQQAVAPGTLASWRDALPSLSRWFQQERARLAPGAQMPFTFQLEAPALVAELPPFEPTAESWSARAWHAWTLRRALAEIDRKAAAARDADLRIYVVLREDTAAGGTWVDGIAAAGGTFGMVRAPRGETELGLPLIAVAHELLHCMGAADRYDAEGHARIPEGLAEPDLRPRFPQRYAEVMTGELPEADGRGRVPRGLAETRVGELTAREVGWLP